MPPATTTICVRWCSLTSFRSFALLCSDFSFASVPSSTSPLLNWAECSLHHHNADQNWEHISDELGRKRGCKVDGWSACVSLCCDLKDCTGTQNDCVWLSHTFPASPDSSPSVAPLWENSTVTQQGDASAVSFVCVVRVMSHICLFLFWLSSGWLRK